MARMVQQEAMYEVVHKMVVIRDAPATTAGTKGMLRQGYKIAGTPQIVDGSPWLMLSSQDLPNGTKIGLNDKRFALIDASKMPEIGVGQILKPLQDEVHISVEETFEVVAKRVVVRAEPSLEAELLGAVEEGDQFKGLVELVDNREWLRLPSYKAYSSNKIKSKAFILLDGQTLGLPSFLKKATGPPKQKAKPKPKPKPKVEPVDLGDLSKWTKSEDGIGGISFRVVLSTVNIRHLPHVKSKFVGVLRQDDIVEGEQRGEWCLLTPNLSPLELEGGKGKWVLIDGKSIGKGIMLERYLPPPELKRVYGEAMEVKLPDKDKEKCSLEVNCAGSDDKCMRCGRGKIMVVHGLTANTPVKLRFVIKAEDMVVAASKWSETTTQDVPEWEEGDDPILDLTGNLRGGCAQCECQGYVMDDNVTQNMDMSDARCSRCGCNVAAHELIEKSDSEEDEAAKRKRKAKKKLKPKGPMLVDKAIALPLETMMRKWSQFDLGADAEKWPTLEGNFKECVAWSDLHSDMGTNMTHLKSLPNCKETVLLLAGDVATNIDTIESSMRLLKEKFGAVFYVPGNHELWVNKEDGLTSVHKFMLILELCEKLGIHTRPAFINDTCAICPLFTWYKDNLVDGFNREMANIAFDIQTMWPWDLTGRGDTHDAQQHEIADFFHRLNTRRLKIAPQEAKADSGAMSVISMSHFVPRQEVYPGPRRLCGVMGCIEVEQQVRDLGASCHIFGHSHTAIDRTMSGIRYVQHPLGYPNDFHRKVRPMRVWGSGASSEPAVVDQLPPVTLGRELLKTIEQEIRNCTQKAMDRPPGRWNDPDFDWDQRNPFDRQAESDLRKALGFDFSAAMELMMEAESKVKVLEITIRSMEDEDESLVFEVAADLTIAKLKDAIVQETGRGPASRIMLSIGGESQLRNETTLSDLDEARLESDGIVLSGISLAPPKPVEVMIKQVNSGPKLKIEVLDNSTMLDVRKAIAAELKEELSNVNVVERVGSSYKNFKDAEVLGDRRELLVSLPAEKKAKAKPKPKAQKDADDPKPPKATTSSKTKDSPEANDPAPTSFDFKFNEDFSISIPFRSDGGIVTVLDLKRAIMAKVMRGPEKAIQLTLQGSTLDDKADLATVKPMHRDKVKLSGIDLGPPKRVQVMIVHAAAEDRQELPITIKDTCRIKDVRERIRKRLGEKQLSQVKIVRALANSGGFQSIPDQEFLNGRLQLFMMGRDLPAPGKAPPEEPEEEEEPQSATPTTSGLPLADLKKMLMDILKDVSRQAFQKQAKEQIDKFNSGNMDQKKLQAVLGVIYASHVRNTIMKYGFTDNKKMFEQSFVAIWSSKEHADVRKLAWDIEEAMGFAKSRRGFWFGIEDPSNTVTNGGGSANGAEMQTAPQQTKAPEKPSAVAETKESKPAPVQKDIKELNLMCTIASEDGEDVIDVLLPVNGGKARTVLDLKSCIAANIGHASADEFELGLADLPEPFPEDMQLDDASLQWSLKKTTTADTEQIQEVFVVIGIDLVQKQPVVEAQSETTELASSESFDLVIYIDREFDLSQTTCARSGMTVAALKEQLAREDPSGMINADDIGFKADGRILGDSEKISRAFSELDLCGKDD